MPQPVDMQTEVARAIMAERIQDAMGRSNLAALQRSQLEADEARLGKESQVNETQETLSEKLDADGGKKDSPSKQRKQKSGDPVEKNAGLRTRRSNDGEDHQLDVRI